MLNYLIGLFNKIMKNKGEITERLIIADKKAKAFIPYRYKDPVFKFGKRYREMNRKEKREYKRWLKKTEQWDAEIVIENLDKEKERRRL